MATSTTNYGFTIAEGSDSVNLLTQLYPNFTSLDSILLPIQNNGTTQATHTKAGTVHQLVRTMTGCSVLRFVATGNYNAGDTFTVDGASVTATSCNGQSLPAGAFVINQSVMAIVNGAVLTVLAGGSSVSDASDVDYDNTGSGLTATNVQEAIDEVYGDIPTSFDADDVTYDNTTSGLTATNVQDAIDELAQGSGGAEHGLYELWANSDISASFAPQTITFETDKINNIDAFVFVCESSAGELYAAQWLEIEKSKAQASPFAEVKLVIPYYSTGIHYCRRSITDMVISGTNVSVTWAGGYLDSTANNNALIPVRVLGLIHNS